MNGVSYMYMWEWVLAFAKSFGNETVKNSREYRFFSSLQHSQFSSVIILQFSVVRRTRISLGTHKWKHIEIGIHK